MKSWFGRKAAPAARPLLHRAWQGAAGLGEWPRNYEAQVREAYLGNPVAQRAVRLVAESVAWAPVYAVRRRGRGQGFGPGAGAGRPGAAREAAAQLLLHGNAFVQMLQDADGGAGGAVRAAARAGDGRAGARPAGPRPIVYKVGEAKARHAGARRARAAGSSSICKALHPLDDHYGLGCLGAAAGAVAMHNAAARWNKALLDNAARPSGALVYRARRRRALAAEQFERLRDELEAHVLGQRAMPGGRCCSRAG